MVECFNHKGLHQLQISLSCGATSHGLTSLLNPGPTHVRGSRGDNNYTDQPLQINNTHICEDNDNYYQDEKFSLHPSNY